MDAIFFTGFPGFLGSELLPRVLERLPEAEAICLVQPRFIGLARERAATMAREHRSLEGRLRLVEGDIAAPGLGLDAAAAVADVVESMATHRPYRPALGIAAAREEIAAGRGTSYDAQVVDACLQALDGGFTFS